MLQKYCRNWDKCGENPITPSAIPVVEINNEDSPLNDEIFLDIEDGKVYMYSEGMFYESEI